MTPLNVGPAPYDQLGSARILALVERFYDAMAQTEPALAHLHASDATPHDGTVSRGSRDRFGLFLIGWLGGPQTYTEVHGHPRLRMRHAHVPIGIQQRDAWLRCMQIALDGDPNIPVPVRAYLDARFAEVADFLRNTTS